MDGTPVVVRKGRERGALHRYPRANCISHQRMCVLVGVQMNLEVEISMRTRVAKAIDEAMAAGGFGYCIEALIVEVKKIKAECEREDPREPFIRGADQAVLDLQTCLANWNKS